MINPIFVEAIKGTPFFVWKPEGYWMLGIKLKDGRHFFLVRIKLKTNTAYQSLRFQKQARSLMLSQGSREWERL